MVAFSVATLTTPLASKAACGLGIVDCPDGVRKIHEGTIPLAGGYSILLAFFAPGVLAFALHYDIISGFLARHPREIMCLVAGAALALAMGSFDDRFDLSPCLKILFQVIVATFAYFGGFSIHMVSNPFGGKIALGLFSYPVTLAWFLGCMNAINLLDGLDGLATGVAFFVVSTGAIMSLLSGNVFAALLCFSLMGALLGFLLYNFNPANVFLGDGGSMLIGFLVAALSLIGSMKSGMAVSIAVPFIALGLPIFDTATSILRRWGHRMPMSVADRRHIHHVLLSLGFSHRNVVLILYGVSLAFAATALVITMEEKFLTGLAVLVLALSGFAVIRIFRFVDIRKLIERIVVDRAASRRRGLAAVESQKALARMRSADNVNDLWECTFEAFRSMDLHHAFLDIEVRDDNHHLFWEHPSLPDSLHEEPHHLRDEWSVFLKLRYSDRLFGKLEIWKFSGQPPSRDVITFIYRIRDGLTKHLLPLVKHSNKETQSADSTTSTAGGSVYQVAIDLPDRRTLKKPRWVYDSHRSVANSQSSPENPIDEEEKGGWPEA